MFIICTKGNLHYRAGITIAIFRWNFVNECCLCKADYVPSSDWNPFVYVFVLLYNFTHSIFLFAWSYCIHQKSSTNQKTQIKSLSAFASLRFQDEYNVLSSSHCYTVYLSLPHGPSTKYVWSTSLWSQRNNSHHSLVLLILEYL